ncbi:MULTISPECIES: hypothetical protein [Paenibacillus]|uniref:Uncharacterized protein n=1 Tax=Paenibacillus amylolyticus TaxID=1451 RepID=A0AAP5LRJ7_PAEAM|nr:MULTISPECIES: hypothetical protein [Paenibacillus]MCM3172002.1 hypothetical protein [Paenibacillus sp. MER 99-2]MDR6724504.1 hypothetical protein [Paenibacillus amylolyticus]
MVLFKDRTLGFWIGFMAASLMLVANIVFLIVNHGDRTFSFITFGLIIAGVLGELLVLLKNYFFAPILPAIAFGVALSMHFYLGFPTLSDVVNGVNFIGGNPQAVLVFGITFTIGTIAALISCFMKQSKSEGLNHTVHTSK